MSIESLCSNNVTLDWVASVFQVIGTLALALPVLRLDMRRRKANDFAAAGDPDMSPLEQKKRRDAARHSKQSATEWNPVHSKLMRIGYFMLLFAVLLSFGLKFCPTA